MFRTASWHTTVLAAKRFCYGSRGEPIQYGSHRLRYVPGTRPVKLKYVESSDVVVRNDARQVDFFLRGVKSGEFILDIGGNVGQYAVLFGSLVGPSGKVISFEPDDQHRAVLRQNLKLNGFEKHITVEGLAISDHNGSHSFFTRNDQMSSLVKTGLGANAGSSDVVEQQVKTVRLDDYIKENHLPPPNWLKIDTEGAEINVLRGAQRLLQSPVTLVCELHPYAWDEFETSFQELLSLIRAAGKSIKYLDPAYKVENGPVHGTVIIS